MATSIAPICKVVVVVVAGFVVGLHAGLHAETAKRWQEGRRLAHKPGEEINYQVKRRINRRIKHG